MSEALSSFEASLHEQSNEENERSNTVYDPDFLIEGKVSVGKGGIRSLMDLANAIDASVLKKTVQSSDSDLHPRPKHVMPLWAHESLAVQEPIGRITNNNKNNVENTTENNRPKEYGSFNE